ncbi:hypothetical protein J1N35_019764 [Gossypium stocksii]|uniref:MULE transposase domain-containing protein n=1 Tax=Gossypium stocksii TaxID=47602 RepID=A0A9D3ZZQ6_9ROSI|nr:hypothetical protein J1N35_019764 [Gossypium stocksii]
MSNFYGSNLNEGNEISMVTSPFFTNRVFESHEELMQWVQNTTFSLGYIIVTRRSKAKENGVVSYVTLICDCGGEYKFKESSKKSGTKKTNCKFRLVDATYKTNKYDLPFVQIVGVTSTNKTFSIAFAFIINEKEENYNWALCLKLTLEECMYPRVIVTDRELALMNTCQQIFPDATRLLCRWHITENIKKHCVLKYLDQVWLSKYKEMFVLVWIDRHLNFGERTTNRVESQHAKLKKYICAKNSSLDKFVGCIDQIVKSQLTSIYESFEKSRIVLKHRHNLQCFRLLRAFVALEALDILEGELQRSSRHQLDSSNSGCKLRHSCECIPLDSIDVFWRKLDLSPSTSVENEDICCDDLNQEPLEQVSDFIDLNQIPNSCDTHLLIKEIPDRFHPYIAHVQDVRGDGNCGFRAISVCLGYGEDQWLYVRHQLLDELLSSYDVYARVFTDGIDELRNSLCFSQSPAPAEHWMVLPMTSVLIANRFGVIFNYLTKQGDITFFPLWRGPKHFQYHHAITIAHVYDNHNVMVQLE